MTDTDRIRDYVRLNPGKAAFFIAKQLNLKSATVSSALKKMVDRGELVRTNYSDSPTWVYYERSNSN